MVRDGTQDRVESEPLLPSREPAVAMLREAVAAGRGPVLLTGEPGSGKTWLVGRLQADSRADGLDTPRWLAIDLATTTTPADLLRAVAVGTGLVIEGTPTADGLRLALADCLAERSAEGRRWSLVVDEAHLASQAVLEELRVLSNRLGQADGFAALILVGQTALAFRLRTRPLAALEARLSARVHLGPIDADEAGLLLGSALDESEVERRHRDAAGNPGRLLRYDPPSRPSGPLRPRPIQRRATTEPVPPWLPSVSPSPLVPSKPPLRVEEGLIEVGWEAADPEPASPPREDRESDGPTDRPERPSAPSEEAIDDPYAALQAWNEWSAGCGQVEASRGSGEDGESITSPVREHPNLRAEPQEDFAPYSQLFSRKRPMRSEE